MSAPEPPVTPAPPLAPVLRLVRSVAVSQANALMRLETAEVGFYTIFSVELNENEHVTCNPEGDEFEKLAYTIFRPALDVALAAYQEALKDMANTD